MVAHRFDRGLSWWLNDKESACQCRRYRFDPWVEITWRRKCQPTVVLLLGKSHGQRSLVGYSPWGRKRVRHDSVTKQQQQLHVPPAGEPWHQNPRVHSHLVFTVGVRFSSSSRFTTSWGRNGLGCFQFPQVKAQGLWRPLAQSSHIRARRDSPSSII